MYVAIFLSIIAPAYTQITGLATLLVLVLRHRSSLKVQTKQTIQQGRCRTDRTSRSGDNCFCDTAVDDEQLISIKNDYAFIYQFHTPIAKEVSAHGGGEVITEVFWAYPTMQTTRRSRPSFSARGGQIACEPNYQELRSGRKKCRRTIIIVIIKCTCPFGFIL